VVGHRHRGILDIARCAAAGGEHAGRRRAIADAANARVVAVASEAGDMVR
jgi:hypothetical protein